MTLSLVPALILFAVFTSPAFAQTTPHQHDHPTAASSGADINVPAGAKDAVATVDRFPAASSSGALAKAGKELDLNVLILESESELHLRKDDKPVTVLGTETMLLQSRAAPRSSAQRKPS